MRILYAHLGSLTTRIGFGSGVGNASTAAISTGWEKISTRGEIDENVQLE